MYQLQGDIIIIITVMNASVIRLLEQELMNVLNARRRLQCFRTGRW